MHHWKKVPVSGDNADIEGQVALLREIIGHSEHLWDILARGQAIDLPNWYLGAGCIAQTVWNYQHGFPLTEHIKDVDLAYFDPHDISEEAELQNEERIRNIFSGHPLKFDVKNQARVHLWYEKQFGYPIEPYRSIEDAINTWPTTATCIGARVNHKESVIYAPFGLNDLFGMIVRPNKAQITKEIYEAKVDRWLNCWPNLKVIPWNEV